MKHAARILKKQVQIRKDLRKGSMDKLDFIQRRFQNHNVSHDSLFQLVFVNFYQLRYVNSEFKSKFFKLLEDCKKHPTLNPASYAEKLYATAGKTFQLSFISKLCATADPTHPIFDSHIKSFYKLKRPRYDQRKDLKKFFDEIRVESEKILSNLKIKKMIRAVRDEFQFATEEIIPDLRLIDLFIYHTNLK